MFRRGPLTFADDGQSGAVNDEVQAGARAGAPKREGEMLTASRERGVIGCREIDAQHPEDRGQDALGLTQRSVEDETERQGGFDGEIGILELPAPPADASRCPRGDRVGREPEGDVASPHEGSVVLGPVPDAIRCLVLRMHSRLHIEIMTRRRSRWSTCRPLLAHRAESAHQRHEEAAEHWRGQAHAFLNLYGFLSQVIPYQDSDLERLYVFLRHLAAKLPRRKSGPAYQFDDEVRLEYYRLQKISEGSISLRHGEARRLDGPTEVGSGLVRPQPVPLSQLIDVVNERFGTDFNQADQLFFDQIVEAAMADDGLRQAASVNPGDKFELVFKNLLDRLFVERMDQNEEIFVRLMNDVPFQKIVTSWMASEAYRRLRAGRC